MNMQQSIFSIGIDLDPRIIKPDHPDWEHTLRCAQASKILAADTETMPIDYEKGMTDDALHPFRNRPRLLQIGVPGPQSDPVQAIAPENCRCLLIDFMGLDHTQPSTWPQSHQDVWAVLKTAVTTPDKLLIIQNGLADLLWWLSWWGWKPHPDNLIDTFITSNMLFAGQTVRHNLAAICQNLFMPVPDKEQQKSDWTAPELNNLQVNYAANDVLILPQLGQRCVKFCHTQAHAIEQQFLAALVYMEYNGLPIDIALLAQFKADYDRVYDELYAPMQVAHIEAQLAAHNRRRTKNMLLAEDINPPPFSSANDGHVKAIAKHLTGKTPKSVNKNYLLKTAEEFPIFKTLSLLRAVAIYRNTITTILDNKRWHREAQCWVISGAIKQFSRSDENTDEDPAGTGRTGSGRKSKGMICPNLQNVPVYGKMPQEIRDLGLRSPREAFLVPGTEKQFFVSDLDAAHARIAASLSKDPMMHSAYTSDTDPHSITVTQAIAPFLDNPPDPFPTNEDVATASKMSDEDKTEWHWFLHRMRDTGKNIYYGNLNDQGVGTFKRTLDNASMFISFENAKKGRQAYWDLYPGLRRFLDSLVEHSRNKDHWIKNPNAGETYWYPVVDPIFGRKIFRRVLPGDSDKGYPPGPKPSEIFSALWLGIEASIMKLSDIRVYRWQLEHPDARCFIGNICHDELDGWTLEPPDSPITIEFADVIQDAMWYTAMIALKQIPPGKKAPKSGACIVNCWNDK